MTDTTPATTDISWYVNAIGDDVQFARSSKAEADQFIGDFIGEGNPYKVPESVVARAVLEVGADLFYRKAAKNGIVAFDGAEQVFRLNRDPMAAAYPLLRRYLVMGL